jgi:ribosomal protein L35
MKTNKSFTSRVKVTRKGKVIARKPGLNHFNAKATRSSKLDKKRGQELKFSKKVTQRFIDPSK